MDSLSEKANLISQDITNGYKLTEKVKIINKEIIVESHEDGDYNTYFGYFNSYEMPKIRVTEKCYDYLQIGDDADLNFAENSKIVLESACKFVRIQIHGQA